MASAETPPSDQMPGDQVPEIAVRTCASQPDLRLYLECDMQQPEWIAYDKRQVVAFSKACPGKQEPNDDSALVAALGEDTFVLAVADGVGGGPVGYKASAIAMKSLADSLRSWESQSDLRPAILDGIENANREILDLGIGAATTLSVVECKAGVARGYQVGDSMALIVGQRGAIRWRSTPHSPVGYAVQSGMIDEDDALHHDELHLVSNVVGSREMHIEIGPAVRLSCRDTILIGSDGLFDNLQFGEVVEIGRAGGPLERMKGLVSLTAERMDQSGASKPGKPDDLAILMLTP